MAKKKEVDGEKVIIKQFADKSSSWWVNYAHYHLNASNELIWCSGESDNEEYRTALESYIKRNKKIFKPREASLFETEEVEYLTLSFGKYSGKKLDEIRDIDKSYCNWLFQNTTDQKIKEQLKTLLKK